MVRIDGKCGKIIRLSGRNRVKLKLAGIKNPVDVGVGFLKAPRGFDKLSSRQMRKVLNKPFHGRKRGQRACISTEEPLYA